MAGWGRNLTPSYCLATPVPPQAVLQMEQRKQQQQGYNAPAPGPEGQLKFQPHNTGGGPAPGRRERLGPTPGAGGGGAGMSSTTVSSLHFQMMLLSQLQPVTRRMRLLQKRRFLNIPPSCPSRIPSTCDPPGLALRVPTGQPWKDGEVSQSASSEDNTCGLLGEADRVTLPTLLPRPRICCFSFHSFPVCGPFPVPLQGPAFSWSVGHSQGQPA